MTGVKGLIQVRSPQAEGLQFQGAGLGPFRSQRIQPGVQVSNVSVVVDQTVHSALRGVGGVRSHGFGIGQRRGTRVGLGQTKIESLEERTPGRINRIGIGPPLFMHRVQVRGVPTIQTGTGRIAR